MLLLLLPCLLLLACDAGGGAFALFPLSGGLAAGGGDCFLGLLPLLLAAADVVVFLLPAGVADAWVRWGGGEGVGAGADCSSCCRSCCSMLSIP
jgi:hypothetical protein